MVPTVIALAIYFCIADVILISQCVYYNTLTARQRSITASTENEPLLRRRSSSMGLPGSNRRQSELHEEDTLSKILEEGDEGGSALMKNSLSVVLVVLAGAAGWAIAWRSGVWTPTPEAGEGEVGGQAVAVGASVLGYFSAVCYLGYVSVQCSACVEILVLTRAEHVSPKSSRTTERSPATASRFCSSCSL